MLLRRMDISCERLICVSAAHLQLLLPLPPPGEVGGVVLRRHSSCLILEKGHFYGLWTIFIHFQFHFAGMSQPSSDQGNPGSDEGQQGETDTLTGGQQPSSQNNRPRHSLRFRMLRFLYKSMGMFTRRGIVLTCAVLTNALVLVCVVSAQFGIIDNNLNLKGTDLELVKELDVQFSQKKLPGVYGGVTFSLIFGVTSLVFVVAGSKAPLQMPQIWMKAAFVFQVVGAVFYVIAVSVYLHFVVAVNSTDECKQRERIYSRNGYTWMNCDVGGADAAAALFGLITVVLYTAGAVFTFQTTRRVTRFLKERAEAENQRMQRGHQ